MKFSPFAFATLVLAQQVQANPQECVADFDPETDYFPDKVSVELAEQFSVEYFNNYKIATNLDAGKSYLLYQCGTEIPADLDPSEYAAVIPIPLTEFGLHYSTFVPFAELLGLRNVQTAQAGFVDYFFSPCFNELIDTNRVALIADLTNETQVANAGVSKDVPFFMGVGSPSVFETNIEISEYKDLTNLGVMEWIKFFAVFFNKEAVANEVYEAAKGRYQCATDNAQLLTSDASPPKLLWASYSTWGGGAFYSASSCPNYYCEAAIACGAELLITPNAMNVTEFVDFAKDADVWLYSSTNFETVLNDFADELAELKSVQNNQLFDIMGHGEDAWFNERKVEPDALLEDLCHVVGNGNPLVPHVPTFFRHVDDLQMSPGECSDLESPYKYLGTFCEPFVLNEAEPEEAASSSDDEAESAAAAERLVGSVLAMAMAISWL